MSDQKVLFTDDVNIYIIQCLSTKKNSLIHHFEAYDLLAYCPQMEYYRRDIKGIAVKDMFPGYLFIQTSLDHKDWEGVLNEVYHKTEGIVRELKSEESDTLTANERLLLSSLLDEQGVMRMSYAVLKDSKAHVTEGPLKRYEKMIRKVDKHNQLAYLNLSLISHEITAGLRFI